MLIHTCNDGTELYFAWRAGFSSCTPYTSWMHMMDTVHVRKKGEHTERSFTNNRRNPTKKERKTMNSNNKTSFTHTHTHTHTIVIDTQESWSKLVAMCWIHSHNTHTHTHVCIKYSRTKWNFEAKKKSNTVELLVNGCHWDYWISPIFGWCVTKWCC